MQVNILDLTLEEPMYVSKLLGKAILDKQDNKDDLDNTVLSIFEGNVPVNRIKLEERLDMQILHLWPVEPLDDNPDNHYYLPMPFYVGKVVVLSKDLLAIGNFPLLVKK